MDKGVRYSKVNNLTQLSVCCITPVSSTYKTDITEILLKVVLNTITLSLLLQVT
jgi:hypothetical protein